MGRSVLLIFASAVCVLRCPQGRARLSSSGSSAAARRIQLSLFPGTEQLRKASFFAPFPRPRLKHLVCPSRPLNEHQALQCARQSAESRLTNASLANPRSLPDLATASERDHLREVTYTDRFAANKYPRTQERIKEDDFNYTN